MTPSSTRHAGSPIPAVAASGEQAAAFAGRLFLATLFILSGSAKVADPQAVIGDISAIGLPFPELGLLAAVGVELGGAAALIVGYRTRLAAAAMALFCVAAAALFHNRFSDPAHFLHFFKDIAITGGLLQVVAFGPGRWSVDAWRRGPERGEGQ